MALLLLLLPVALSGADLFLLQTENAFHIDPWRLTLLGEGGAETGPIPDGFLSAGVTWDMLNLLSVRASATPGAFPNQGQGRLDSVDASVRIRAFENDLVEIQPYVFVLAFLNDPIYAQYTGSLSNVVYVLSPRAEGGYDVGSGATGFYCFGSTGLAICGDVDLAYTGGRQSFVGFSDLLASLRLRAYVSPAYRITSMWSVAVQNRFVYWFNRGYMYEVLPQAQWDVVPALSLSAGIGLPVVGGNVWRFIAGVRWAPTFSAPSPSGLEVFKEGENLRMRVYFNFLGDKADLFEPKNTQYGPKNHDLIAQVVSRLNQYPEYDIVVEGHTNRVKFEKSFEEEQSAEMIPLARDRAAAVAQALVAAGIARERLSVAAIGGSRPLSKFEDKENCWKNRRVEIVLKKKTR